MFDQYDPIAIPIKMLTILSIPSPTMAQFVFKRYSFILIIYLYIQSITLLKRIIYKILINQ